MPIRIGCVPFVNAKPLIAQFAAEDRDIEVVLAPPSELPAMLDRDEADAVLASSFDALRTPERRIAADVSISSVGAAESVRVFSKVPFEEVASLALDSSSLTSNALAQIVLRELHGVRPRAVVRPPSLIAMLRQFDAAVLIGDLGMSADPEGLHVLDLGSGWSELTGLPFVWALWIGRDRLDPELAATLLEARRWGEERLSRIAADAAHAVGWDDGVCRHYLGDVMRYGLDPKGLEALTLFGQKMVEHGLIETAHAPEVVAREAQPV